MYGANSLIFLYFCLYCRCLSNQFKRLSVASSASAASFAPHLPSSLTTNASLSSRVAVLFPQLQVREMGYKLKTKSAVKKRFKVNANGLVKRAQANKRHLATKKTRERIRRLGKPVFVEGQMRKNILNLLHK